MDTVDAMKQELIRLLCDKAFQYSREPKFKLVSGAVSRFYVNCKPVTLSPRGMILIGHLIYHQVRKLSVDAVGGMTFGADPMACAVAFVSGLKGTPIKAFSIRKTQKDHGIVRWVEGDVTPGERVAVIDDVATTGGSTLRAIERCRHEGLHVAGAVVLVDRQEGGLENIRKAVPRAAAVVTREELMACWRSLPQSP